MTEEKSFETIAPEFFPFTNYTDHDFSCRWDSVEYTFPARSTKNLLGVINSASPEDIQFIRKKFARDLATIVWYQQDKFKYLEGQTPVGFNGSLQQAATYTDSDLEPFIQRCLEPLPVAKVIETRVVREKIEEKLSIDDSGKKRSRVLKGDENLVKEAETAE